MRHRANQAKKRKRLFYIYILVPLIILMGVLTYFQLWYKAERVNGGIAVFHREFTGHRHIVSGVRFSPDGHFIASGSVDSTLQVWETESGKVKRRLKQPTGITCLNFHPDGMHIVTSGYDGRIRLWNIAEGKIEREFPGHVRTAWSLATSPDGKIIASGSEDATVKLWDVETGKLIRTLEGHTLTVWGLKFSPDGSRIATGSYDETLKIWDAKDGTLLHDIRAHSEAIVDVAFSPDGKILASASDDKLIRLWNVADAKPVQTLEGSPEHVQGLVFSPDGGRLLSSGRDKPMIGELLQNFFGDSKYNPGVSMRLWDLKTGRIIQTFHRHANDANDIAWSPDGRWIASASADHTVHVWRIVK